MISQRSQANYVRKVEGEVLSASVASTSVGRIELFSRRVSRHLYWHFCQPEMTLFWHRDGFERMQGTIDGKPVDRTFVGESRFSIFPQGAEIKMEFELQPRIEYAIVFFDLDKVAPVLCSKFNQAHLCFSNDGLTNGLSELCREAENADVLFELFAEGSALQALAHVTRVSGSLERVHSAPRGGLRGMAFSRVDTFIRQNLAEPITLEMLASIAGVSKRHFVRSFYETVGMQPHRYVVALRIDEAKRQLTETRKSINDIALDCGFSHAQHFSTSFRNSAGLAPSEYRKKRTEILPPK